MNEQKKKKKKKKNQCTLKDRSPAFLDAIYLRWGPVLWSWAVHRCDGSRGWASISWWQDPGTFWARAADGFATGSGPENDKNSKQSQQRIRDSVSTSKRAETHLHCTLLTEKSTQRQVWFPNEGFHWLPGPNFERKKQAAKFVKTAIFFFFSPLTVVNRRYPFSRSWHVPMMCAELQSISLSLLSSSWKTNFLPVNSQQEKVLRWCRQLIASQRCLEFFLANLSTPAHSTVWQDTHEEVRLTSVKHVIRSGLWVGVVGPPQWQKPQNTYHHPQVPQNWDYAEPPPPTFRVFLRTMSNRTKVWPHVPGYLLPVIHVNGGDKSVSSRRRGEQCISGGRDGMSREYWFRSFLGSMLGGHCGGRGYVGLSSLKLRVHTSDHLRTGWFVTSAAAFSVSCCRGNPQTWQPVSASFESFQDRCIWTRNSCNDQPNCQKARKHQVVCHCHDTAGTFWKKRADSTPVPTRFVSKIQLCAKTHQLKIYHIATCVWTTGTGSCWKLSKLGLNLPLSFLCVFLVVLAAPSAATRCRCRLDRLSFAVHNATSTSTRWRSSIAVTFTAQIPELPPGRSIINPSTAVGAFAAFTVARWPRSWPTPRARIRPTRSAKGTRPRPGSWAWWSGAWSPVSWWWSPIPVALKPPTSPSLKSTSLPTPQPTKPWTRSDGTPSAISFDEILLCRLDAFKW